MKISRIILFTILLAPTILLACKLGTGEEQLEKSKLQPLFENGNSDLPDVKVIEESNSFEVTAITPDHTIQHPNNKPETKVENKKTDLGIISNTDSEQFNKIDKITETGDGRSENKSLPIVEEKTELQLFSGPDHSSWNQLLKSYVKNGKVNYNGFLNDPALDQYLRLLTDNHPKSSWTADEQLAYWINAYNAFTIKLITEHYPVKSIMDIHQGKPWDVKWIKIGKHTYSLNQIENEIIRPQFNEPRIHFAVNCAATSCPPLADEAFTPSNLDQLLEQQTIAFINNPSFNTIESGNIKLSKIFEWYAVDFGDLKEYIKRYSKTPITNKVNITYLEYDWSLNGK